MNGTWIHTHNGSFIFSSFAAGLLTGHGHQSWDLETSLLMEIDPLKAAKINESKQELQWVLSQVSGSGWLICPTFVSIGWGGLSHPVSLIWGERHKLPLPGYAMPGLILYQHFDQCIGQPLDFHIETKRFSLQFWLSVFPCHRQNLHHIPNGHQSVDGVLILQA